MIIMAEKLFSAEIINALIQMDIGISAENIFNKPVNHLTKDEQKVLEPYAPGSNMKRVLKLKASNKITVYFFFDDSNDIPVIWVSKKLK